MAHNPLDHVLDSTSWTIFDSLFGGFKIHLPNLFGLQITRFMVLEVIAAVLVIAIFVPLCRRAHSGGIPKGAFWNAFESLLTFIRNDVAKPNLGEEDADQFVPFLWTMFVFILFCNLLGMIPLMGSPTASIYMILGLAVFSFTLMHGAAVLAMGPIRYLKSLWPHIEIMPYPGGDSHESSHAHDDHGHVSHRVAVSAGPSEPSKPVPWWHWPLWLIAWLFGLLINLMIFALELVGTVIKSGVLALRLFANMFAGHLVLASILLLIVSVGNSSGFGVTWGATTLISVVGVVALSLLELFVAFLQAFVFVFLTALFIGFQLHPSH